MAVLAFLSFLLADYGLVVSRFFSFDERASEWIEFLCADGQRKCLASDGLPQFLPQCVGMRKLRQSWKLMEIESLATRRAANACSAFEPVGFSV